MQLSQQQNFSEIVLMIRESHSNAVKAVNTELINLYWNVGQYISKKLASATWGDKTVEDLATFIQKEYPKIKGFNHRGLYKMKQFYETYTSMSFVSSSMTQIQNTDNKGDQITSSSMTPFAFKTQSSVCKA